MSWKEPALSTAIAPAEPEAAARQVTGLPGRARAAVRVVPDMAKIMAAGLRANYVTMTASARSGSSAVRL